MTDTPIYIYASQQATDSVALSARDNLTGVKSTRLAMGAALEQAGMKISEIPLAEVHDCFTIEEVMYMEDSGFYNTGEAWKGIFDSYKDYEGLRHIPYVRGDAEVIVNPGGGLKADGHPVGATGVRQVFEVYRQLRGEAGDCQVESDGDLDAALCHNIGGTGGICTVHIFGRGA
ncbi:hypothetical protein H8D40_01495 [Candidatus Bathyarchaeota archaeon]|nr:hypothetical protein [Candidatus Bathyarchaeota archaeon]